MDHFVGYALLLTTIAGCATGIGSAVAYFAHHTKKNVLSLALGFSAGVMIYVSFVELYRHSDQSLSLFYGDVTGKTIAALSFFCGMLLIALIDFFVPSYENPHEAALVEEIASGVNPRKLHRLGLMTAVAITIHNFPEGMAIFFAASTDLSIAIPIAVAIALHNIPEGISISVPIYYATGSRKKAFWYSFLSGLSEPLGAIIGYLVLRPFLSEQLMGIVFAMVAGIMVFISLDMLIPHAKKYSTGHQSVYGLLGGMALMAATLVFL
ncbi:MAG TPA: zinc transporter ZupT [Acidobacteriota bacterium]|nr:zinc transporter ZupT [Acidobacteriota bacterium]